MAIDSRRKRASAAVLGLAFLAPSVVPDGTLGSADRQAIAHSYYGIDAGGAVVEIGGTSQLEAYSSSGVITLERVIGGTSQIEAYSSSGGITVERTLGSTSQLPAFTSSGGITVGTPVETTAAGGGGGYRKRKQRQFANIDGKLVEVASYAEAVKLYQHINKTKKKPKKRRIKLKFNGAYVSIFDDPDDLLSVKELRDTLDHDHQLEEEAMILLLLAA